MPELPHGDPAPPDGALPEAALAERASAFGIYLHVPFCRVRCGYCDFNTYTPGELGVPSSTDPSPFSPDLSSPDLSSPDTFVRSALAELDLAAEVLGAGGRRPPVVDTVFVGGGTPTLLPAADLGSLLRGIRDRFEMAANAEVTTEANPDTIDTGTAQALATAGFTRISVGMQSAVPHVLATLDRTHDPARVATAVSAAKAAGLATSLDLIYGTPGESIADWADSLDAALALEPDHLSAYALTVEPGTALAARVRRGELSMPEGDDEAAKYELADDRLSARGWEWYEVSNWSRTPAGRCRHNLGYWRGDAWWGIGPGAHSHVSGVRWWNVKHPRSYAARLASGASPAAGRETLGEHARWVEDVLLRVRLREGLPLTVLTPDGRAAIAGLIADGLLDGADAIRAGRAVLTRRGRLLADQVVRRLTD